MMDEVSKDIVEVCCSLWELIRVMGPVVKADVVAIDAIAMMPQ